ncbi:MAG: hypothetical protein H6983_12965 [Ectothiorhodospiraceae bacterium]|nr:hypothetical protein [Ectothiorhodospiraceae bacterium]
MRALSEVEALLALDDGAAAPRARAASLLALCEEVLAHWVSARGGVPTDARREGFRLLALHRQGCRGEPSFNACRETCREIAYHYNLVSAEPDHPQAVRQVRMMGMLAMHLYLFVTGKLEVAALGDFCCSSRPLRAQTC